MDLGSLKKEKGKIENMKLKREKKQRMEEAKKRIKEAKKRIKEGSPFSRSPNKLTPISKHHPVQLIFILVLIISPQTRI